MAASLLSKSLGQVKDQQEAGSGPTRRTSGGGGTSKSSPYARPTPASGGAWKHDMYGAKGAAGTSPGGGGPRFAESGGAAGGGRKSRKLKIENLHYEVSEKELQALFAQIGPLASPPSIKFDRSGRSQGIAWLAYETEKHAESALEAFNGAPAKGQNIVVRYDYRFDPVVAAPGTLLARMEPDASTNNNRRSRPTTQGQAQPPRNAPTGPRNAAAGAREGSGRGGAAVGGGRGGRAGGGAGGKRAPATSTSLDAELEAFMNAPSGTKETEATATSADVDMS